MRLARVLQMPPAEIAFRGRAEARKWWDRWLAPGAALRPDRPDGDAHFGRFVERCRTQFFAGALEEETAREMERSAPGAVALVMAAADSARRGRFDLLGYEGLDFGHPVDWHLDPLAGRRTPLAHWSRIRPLDASRTGDCKVVWELNRHQWMLALGQAYRHTGDERYAAAFAGSVHEWLAANPRGRGINWTSSLELAFRLIAWCWALVLFRGSPEVTPGLFRALRTSLASQAAHVAAFPSSYFSPNTHLTGEALGLFYAGLLFPGLPAAARWREMGRRILVDEIERQVLEDGVYFEQSAAYQCYTAEIYLHFLVLAGRNDVPVPSHVAERVQLLLDFLLGVRRPDGLLPAIGDADGGRLLPLVKRGPDDARGLFAVAAAVFARADYAWAAGGPAPEVRWLLGADGVAAFAALTPRPPQGPPSRAFPAGGYVVFRSGWDASAHQLIFDAGPLGCPVSGAHGHADLLSLQASAFGQPFLVDPGTGAYVPGAARDHFRGALAHSTLTIDGASQARPQGPFSWNERPHARLHDWTLENADESAAGAHDAYARPGRALRHRRRILFARRFWLVVDDVLGSGTRRVEQRFQFAPLSLSLETSGWVRARSDAGACLWLRALAAVPLAVEVHEGAAVLGWVSPHYGQRRPAPHLVWSADAALPFRIVTVLLPLPSPDLVPPDLTLRADSDGMPAEVVVGDERVELRGDAFVVS